MINSQDTISSFLLKLDDETQLDGVMDAPSIAIVTLQLLYKLGFNPIILVGQNLAYVDDRHYADGIAYGDEKKINLEYKDRLYKVKDVYGNEIHTNFGFNLMRTHMEKYIQLMPDTTIINTTRGGAHIEGTKFEFLETLIKEKVLADKVVDDNWFEIPLTEYDREYLQKQFDKLQKDYAELEPELRSILSLLSEINSFIVTNNLKQLESSWPKLDRAFKRLQSNCFFDKVIRLMNRISYELLVGQLPIIRFEKDPIKKAEMVMENCYRLVKGSLDDLQSMEEMMEDLQDLVRQATEAG